MSATPPLANSEELAIIQQGPKPGTTGAKRTKNAHRSISPASISTAMILAELISVASIFQMPFCAERHSAKALSCGTPTCRTPICIKQISAALTCRT